MIRSVQVGDRSRATGPSLFSLSAADRDPFGSRPRPRLRSSPPPYLSGTPVQIRCRPVPSRPVDSWPTGRPSHRSRPRPRPRSWKLVRPQASRPPWPLKHNRDSGQEAPPRRSIGRPAALSRPRPRSVGPTGRPFAERPSRPLVGFDQVHRPVEVDQLAASFSTGPDRLPPPLRAPWDRRR